MVIGLQVSGNWVV